MFLIPPPPPPPHTCCGVMILIVLLDCIWYHTAVQVAALAGLHVIRIQPTSGRHITQSFNSRKVALKMQNWVV